MSCHASRSRSPVAAAVVGLGAILAGCDEPATPAARPPIQTRQTIGKTTQTVLELSRALADGGVVVEGGVTSGGLDAITDAARSSAGTIGTLAVEQKVRLYEAEHGRKPLGYDEFVSRIIAAGTPDAVSLPMLPYYQEWAYDPAAKKVVVVEFPARKEQRRQETTGPGLNL
ncbi:MAG: hypothetical protein ACKOCX_03270 [Planctomycetota bacterium]